MDDAGQVAEVERRFVITGVSRLSVRVAQQLRDTGASVSVVASEADDANLLGALDGTATVLIGGMDRARALRDAGLPGAGALLALDDDDLENLRSVSCATVVDPAVAIVLRSFDAALADQLELSSNIRRAYSLSAFAAPSLVAAAIGETALQTLRLGSDEVPLVQLTVREGGPLEGRTPTVVRARTGATVVARGSGRGWAPVVTDDEITAGEDLLVGGLLDAVLTMAIANNPLSEPPWLRRERAPEILRRPKAGITATLLPATTALLLLLMIIATIVFSSTRDLPAVDALYFTVTTAWGDASLIGSDPWQEAFGLLLMIGTGALIGVLFSHIATIAGATRSEYRMERQARRKRGHAVVVGLGTIGYRVVRLLDDLDVDIVAIENVAGSRFIGAASAHGPILIGDARLPEDMARTAVERAACLIAAADDDLVNISACLQAKAANPAIRTVARIYDETIADHVSGALGVDAVVSTSRTAASVFVSAAVDDRAPRTVALGDLELRAFRHTFASGPPTAETVATWRAAGVHILATDADGTTAIVCGPADSAPVQELLGA